MGIKIELKWHQKPKYIILCLILIFPLGLYYMWKNKIWSKTIRWIITIVLFFVLLSDSNDVIKSDSVNVVDINDCLSGYDWCLPDCNNATYAWKFNSDGSFNYSTTLFGGMSAWGNWQDIGNKEIKIVYTRTSTGDVLPDNIISMPSCTSLKIHSSIYYR